MAGATPAGQRARRSTPAFPSPLVAAPTPIWWQLIMAALLDTCISWPVRARVLVPVSDQGPALAQLHTYAYTYARARARLPLGTGARRG